MHRSILTIDLGTTYFKVAQFNDSGQILALKRVSPPIARLGDHWELPADAFLNTVRQAIDRLRAISPDSLASVVALTFSTQTNSFILLDEHDVPLTPLILWPDERARDIADQVRALASDQEMQSIAGLPAVSNQFVPAKLLWLRQRHPELWRRARRFCLISDYLTYWLSHQHASEAGAISFTGLVDIHRLDWWHQMLDRLELPEHWLPRIVRAGADLGPIRPDAAAQLGLPRACRIIVGAFDQHAGAIGVGNIAPGGASETTGTALVCVRCADRPVMQNADTLYQGPGHSPGIYYQMGVSDLSASLLEFYRGTLPDCPSFEQLSLLAENATPDVGLHLTGNLRPTSLDDLFLQRRPEHTRGQLVRCIMEAVAEELAALVTRLWQSTSSTPIRAAGGAARSDFWLQLKANRARRPFAATFCPEPTSLGAAMLAAKALRWYTLEESTRHWVQLRRTFSPLPR